MKQCMRCNKKKSEKDFWKDRNRPDGLNPYCKPCSRQMKKGYGQKSTCDHCGISIKVNSCESKRSKNHFCSQRCSNEWKRGRPTKPRNAKCDQCGKKIRVPDWKRRLNKNHFCSRLCFYNWKRDSTLPNTECDNCGKPLRKTPSELAQNENSFCSNKCQGEGQRKRVEVECSNCGEKLWRHPYRLRDYAFQFCNKKCHAEWRSKNLVGEASPRWSQVEVVCAECGTHFSKSPSQINRSKNDFCGPKCAYVYLGKSQVGENNPNWVKPIKTTCAACGAPLERNPSRVGVEERNIHFCNPQCRGDWFSENRSGENSYIWKGGCIRYYGPNWNKQSRRARKRDRYICQVCGKTQKENGRALDVHHIRPFREFGYIPGENDYYLEANCLDNLISLCPQCHRAVECGQIAI